MGFNPEVHFPPGPHQQHGVVDDVIRPVIGNDDQVDITVLTGGSFGKRTNVLDGIEGDKLPDYVGITPDNLDYLSFRKLCSHAYISSMCFTCWVVYSAVQV